MINPFAEVQWRPDREQRRKFAKSLMIGFPVVGGVLLLLGWARTGYWNAHLAPAAWIGGAGAVAGAIFWLIPQISRPFYVTWYFAACCVGFIVGNVLMAAFYYLAVTGIGLGLRLMGGLSFSKNFDRTAKTYWKDAPPPPPPSRYFKQF